MIFRQVFEPGSSTYTYLLGCRETGTTALIDPVLETVDRDLALLAELGLKLDFTVDTHVHADHVTAAWRLKSLTGSRIANPGIDELPCADIRLQEGTALRIGNVELHPLFTPGHTDHHHAYLVDNRTQKMLFSGDALLIDGCGRTDFQSGDPVALYQSITEKFFRLPDETLVYPCHDYHGRRVSCIAQEKERNRRIGNNRTQKEFVKIMQELDLPYPRKLDIAVPANEACGQCPDDLPETLRSLCERGDQG